MDTRLIFPLYTEIPYLGVWCDLFTLNGVDTEVRIKKIYGLKWDSKKGCLIIHCEIDYFINEYHEDFKEPDKNPKLTLIK